MQAILRHHGWHARGAKSIAEALPLLDGPLDCLALDIMLPDGEGTQLLEYVRRQNLPVRVVVTTGTSDPEVLQRLTDLKPTALLRKPIDVAELIRLLAPPTDGNH